MSGPDHDAIRAALILGIHAVEAANYADDFVVDAEMDSVVATVAALMEDYAADLRAEIDDLRDRGNPSWSVFDLTVEAVVRERLDAYAADLRAEVERLLNADGEHMADLATTIKIQAEHIATLSNQLDYANQGKAELESVNADMDRHIKELDAAFCDRGAYAAEKVRAALLDAADAILSAAPSYTTEGHEPDEAPWDLFTRIHAARIVRNRAGAS